MNPEWHKHKENHKAHIIIKLLKTGDKEKYKAAKEKRLCRRE